MWPPEPPDPDPEEVDAWHREQERRGKTARDQSMHAPDAFGLILDAVDTVWAGDRGRKVTTREDVMTQLAKWRAQELATDHCTDTGAGWCQLCGDCSCNEEDPKEPHGDWLHVWKADCPLHGEDSEHGWRLLTMKLKKTIADALDEGLPIEEASGLV